MIQAIPLSLAKMTTVFMQNVLWLPTGLITAYFGNIVAYSFISFTTIRTFSEFLEDSMVISCF